MKSYKKHFIFCAVLLCSIFNELKAQILTLSDIEQLVKDNAPIVYFHPDEPYLPSSVDWFLERSDLYKRTGSTYQEKGQKIGAAVQNLSQATLPQADNDGLVDISQSSDDLIARKYYFQMRDESNWPGNLNSAKLYANVTDLDGGIGINYWIFYPYNGAGRVKVTAPNLNYSSDNIVMGKNGTHQGDWERVTVVLDKSSKALKHVYFEAHGDVYKSMPNQIERQNGQLVAYASLNGHGFYAKTGLNGTSAVQILERAVGTKLGVQLLNVCEKGGASLNGKTNHQIIGINLEGAPSLENAPNWVQYPYMWGGDVTYQSDKKLAKDVLKGLTKNNTLYNLVIGGEAIFDELLKGFYKVFTPVVTPFGGNNDEWNKTKDVYEFDVLDNLTQELNMLAFAGGLDTNAPPGPKAKLQWQGGKNELYQKPESFYTQENVTTIVKAMGMNIDINKVSNGFGFTLKGKTNKNLFKGDMKIMGKTGNKNGLTLATAIPTNLNCEVKINQSITNYIADELDKKGIKGFGSITNTVNVNWIRYKGLLSPLKNQNPSVKLEVQVTFAGKKYIVKTPTVTLTQSGIKNLSGAIVNAIINDLKNKIGNPIMDVATDVGDFTINTAEDFEKTMVSAANDAKDFFNDIGGAIECWFGNCGGNSIQKYKPNTGQVPIFFLTNKANHRAIPGKKNADHNKKIYLEEKPGAEDFWVLLPHKNKTHYFIKSMDADMYLANFGSKNDRADVKVTHNPGSGALWKMEVLPNGFFRLKNLHSGKYLGVSNGHPHSLLQSVEKNDRTTWKGGKTDYMKPSEVLAGKGKIVATLHYKANYGGLKSYLRFKNYSKKEFGGIFPHEELRSIKVNSGFTVTLYNKSDKKVRIVESTKDLAHLDFGDESVRASTRKYDNNLDKIIVKLYEYSDYKGDYTYLFKDGGDSRQIGTPSLNYGVDGDKVTSFKLTSGYKVTLYDDDDYKNNGKTFTKSIPDLGDGYDTLEDDIRLVKFNKN